MDLIASFDRGHWKLAHGSDIECLALKEFNLRDDLICLQLSTFARLDGYILALSHDFDLAIFAVENSEANSLVNLIRIVEADSLICEILHHPLTTF